MTLIELATPYPVDFTYRGDYSERADGRPYITVRQPKAPVAPVEPTHTDPPGKEPTKETGREPQTDAVISLNFALTLTSADLAKLDAEQIKALFDGVGRVVALKGATD